MILSTFVGVVTVPMAAGTADGRPAPHDPAANYTFSPDNHAPETENTGAEHYAVGLEEDLTALHTIVVESEAFDFSDCSSTDTEAFGIDRGNDDPGTQTDEGLVTKYKSIDFRANKIVVEFYKEGGIGQSTVGIKTNDQIVARSGGCYDTPDEAGWYQVTGSLNGSTNDNTNTDYGISVKTHYIYVCDCDSRQEAVDKLGPPPSEQSDGGGDSSTATPTPTSAPTESSGGGDTSTATPTPTSTPTESGNGGDTSTATPTSGGGDTGTGANDTSDTSTSTANTSTTDPAQPDGTDDSTEESSVVGDGDSNVSGTTPTSSGSGPGFGLLAALGALATGGLLARRRDD